MPPDSDF